MTGKSELVERIADRVGGRPAAAAALDAVLAEIGSALAQGERVTLTGFGTFEAAPRAARQARNPRTGEVVAVPATTVARFHPGATLRASLVGGAVRPTSAASVGKAARAEKPAGPTKVPATPAVEGKGGRPTSGTVGDAEPGKKSGKKSGKPAKPDKPDKPGKGAGKGDKAADKKSGKKSGKSGKGSGKGSGKK